MFKRIDKKIKDSRKVMSFYTTRKHLIKMFSFPDEVKNFDRKVVESWTVNFKYILDGIYDFDYDFYIYAYKVNDLKSDSYFEYSISASRDDSDKIKVQCWTIYGIDKVYESILARTWWNDRYWLMSKYEKYLKLNEKYIKQSEKSLEGVVIGSSAAEKTEIAIETIIIKHFSITFEEFDKDPIGWESKYVKENNV